MANGTTTHITYCTFCAMHNHTLCNNDECECGQRDHNPSVEVAAAMRRYENPGEAVLRTEQLASNWHRKDEQR
jgi:hypothetical protein